MRVSLYHTYYLDFLWYIGTIILFNQVFRDDKSIPVSHPKFALIFLLLTKSWQVKEMFYIRAFGKYYKETKWWDKYFRKELSKYKTLEAESTTVNLGTVGSVLVCAVANHFGVFEWQRIDTRVYGKLWLLSLINQIVFDLFYGTLHHLSHKYYYWPHKSHHSAKRDVSSINMGANDPAETILSIVFGVIFPCVCYYFWGVRFHIFGLWIHINQKLMQHSANPYSSFMWNPLLDMICKPTIAHSLHHVLTTSHMYTIPWHHFIQGYGEDVRIYNRIFETNLLSRF